MALLVAEAISTIGSRMSMLAIPWLVLVSTGDPVKVGLVSAAEMLPYVLSGVLAAPLQDKLGARRTAIIADLSSVVVLGAIAVGHMSFGLLLILVALAGTLRAQADRSKNNLLKPLMDLAKSNYTRITSAYAGIVRTANLIGASVGGVAIASLGAFGALWLNAATFAVCGTLVLLAVPQVKVAEATTEPYFDALRLGFVDFKRDRLIQDVTWLLLLINLFAQASTVIFVPLWVFTVLHSPVALGVVSVAFALGGIIGNIVFTAAVPYLKRYSALTTGFIIGGAPTLLVLALTDNIFVVAAVTFIGGFAMCSVNPTIGALIYQRVPSEMLARVGGIIAAVTFAGIPLGGLVGGFLVQQFGLTDGILVASAIFFGVTLLPVIRRHLWIELNETTKPIPPISQLRVVLSYSEGDWTVRVRRGWRAVGAPQPVASKIVLSGLDQLDVPAIHEAIGRTVDTDVKRTLRRSNELQEQLARTEFALADISEALARGGQR